MGTETEARCVFCHDRIDIVSWKHPVTGKDYNVCSFCARSIIGVCHRCNEILVNVDRYGVDEKGYKMCSKCAAASELADEESGQKGR